MYEEEYPPDIDKAIEYRTRASNYYAAEQNDKSNHSNELKLLAILEVRRHNYSIARELFKESRAIFR